MLFPDPRRVAAQEWAQRMLASSAVLLDTETTGLDGKAEIVSIGIVGMNGQTIFDSLLRPTREIPAEITKLHGITNEQVRQAPTIASAAEALRSHLMFVPVVIYNARFDMRMLRQSLKAYNETDSWLSALDVHCAMIQYSAYMLSPKWLSLQGGHHSAVGDCLATLEVIRRMAKGD